jgi:hypothetical protein
MLEGYKAELEGILSRFKKTSDAIHIQSNDDSRYREIVLELRGLFSDEFVDGSEYVQPLVNYFNDSISNWLSSPSYRGVDNVRGVLTAAIARVKRNPFCIKSIALTAPDRLNKIKGIENVTNIINRFHLVVRQIRQRHSNREPFNVQDEYDVQDLFHSLLTLFFDDIRKEEWTPSYAGGSSRIDFLLPEIDTVIEVKKTRESLGVRQLGDQLIVDIEKYQKHPMCRTLICFVYDPEGWISNPRGLENDLSRTTDEIDVSVLIVPKGY